jgi:membrane fusion protein, copper/silver efflux system
VVIFILWRNYMLKISFGFLAAISMSFGISFAQMQDHGQMQSMNGMNMSDDAKSIVFVTPDAFKSQLDPVYKAYLSIQASLASDELQKAQTNVPALAKSLNAVDMKLLTDMKTHMAWMASSEKLAKDAGNLSSAKDIETARTEFKLASNDLIAIAKQFGTSGKTPLYMFHCPMALKNKGADWVQDEKTVKNPYFGKTMLTCGTITDAIIAKTGK